MKIQENKIYYVTNKNDIFNKVGIISIVLN